MEIVKVLIIGILVTALIVVAWGLIIFWFQVLFSVGIIIATSTRLLFGFFRIKIWEFRKSKRGDNNDT